MAWLGRHHNITELSITEHSITEHSITGAAPALGDVRAHVEISGAEALEIFVESASSSDDLELIDETRPPTRGVLVLDSSDARRPRTHTSSAVPQARPMTISRATLPWGEGTDGWPHRRSRAIRLFLRRHDELAAEAAGARWGRLVLDGRVETSDDAEATLTIVGELQMPYPSPPLVVELRAQPFERRFSRVDLVLMSRRRFPRRYFDVASRSLAVMHVLERPEAIVV